MLLSINWLLELTPYTGSLDELAHLLTMLGLEVEEQQHPFASLEQFRVGRVSACSPHPNADTLSLCQVQLGSDTEVQIVCGAPNVAQGQNVAVAPVGSTLPQGQAIKAAKIRGQASKGMILSEQELGLGEDHSGIMVLDPELEPGTPLVQALALDTVVFDLGITPNRSDCLSVLGVAREVAAACNLPLYLPRPELVEQDPDCSLEVSVQIHDPLGCPVYQARIVDDISIGPSPAWMRYRLLGMGIRPINCVVDVTNYVMLELGQPLHAFDRERLAGHTVQVARAGSIKTFTTLDEQERSLQEQDLLIWDSQQPVALAGVMGGANSEITDSSRSLLLESAVFDPASIRKTGRRLGLSSESSYRFERGVDQPGSSLALDRAAQLVHSLAGGRILRGQAKSEPRPWQGAILPFRPQRATNLLALDVDHTFCHRTLTNLGCQVDDAQEAWQVTPPSYRLDLEREVDLIEEIGRVYGLESIPATLPTIAKPLQPAADPDQGSVPYAFMRRIKAWAQGVGLSEVINYSFVGGSELDRLQLPVQDRVLVHNPLSSDQDSLRTSLTPGLLRNVRLNADQGNATCRLFEVARTFAADAGSETTACEQTKLALLLTGLRHPDTWPWNKEEADYLDLKGLVEHLSRSLQLTDCTYIHTQNHPFFSPAVILEYRQERLGFLGQIDPSVARKAHARSPIWMAELDLDRIYALYRQQAIHYHPWPKFPPVHRDMTLIASPGVSFDQIEHLIGTSRHKFLEDCRLVDVYQPGGSQERHLTLRMRYRHPHKTLTDKEVDKQHTALGTMLTSELPLRFPAS